MRWAWVFLLALGCAAPAEVDDEPRVAGLIEALGDPDLETRTLAMGELRRLGLVAEDALRENLRHPDVEIAARCAELVRKRPAVQAYAEIVSPVLAVNPVRGFVVIGAGRGAGVAGLRFEIVRGTRWIASAEFEKFYGDGGRCSKLRITAGRVVDVRLGDDVVGF